MGIQLDPPGAEGAQWDNMVTRPGGVPVGQGPNENEYFSPDAAKNAIKNLSKDEIDAVLEGDLFLSPIGTQLKLVMHSSPTNLVQTQLDNLDPSSPTIPLIKKFIEISENLLRQGNIIAAQGTQGAKKQIEGMAEANKDGFAPLTAVEQQKQAEGVTAGIGALNADDITARKTKLDKAYSEGASALANVQTSSNKWLAGNAYVEFLVNYWEMLLMLKESKIVDSRIEIAGIEMFMELAKNAADAIMDRAHEAFVMKIVSAVMAAVNIVVIAVTTAVSVAMTMRMKAEQKQTVKDSDSPGGTREMTKAEVRLHNKKLEGSWYGTMTMQSIQQGLTNSTKVIDNIVGAIQELNMAKYEALKEMLVAYRQMAQMQFDKSAEAFKSNSELITQVIQQIDQIRAKLQEAIVAMYKKS